jgi:acyl-CoA thioester hydrolase
VSEPTILDLRVRYVECDPMGVAHHSSYPVWFEMGRTEWCRTHAGGSYRALESEGIGLVVVDLHVKYRRPARYDDVVRVETKLTRLTRARLEHAYVLSRDGVELTVASTVVACVDADGRARAIPESILALG